MSSAMNHARRSRRGYKRTQSVCGNIIRTNYRFEAGKHGAGTTPLIFRLQGFKRRILEHRKRQAEAAEA